MGSFDGAETCELVGTYLLSKLTPLLGNTVALCRDDRLAALNKTPREIENIKKQICTTFNDHNLRLTIEANKKRVDYLDVTLDQKPAATSHLTSQRMRYNMSTASRYGAGIEHLRQHFLRSSYPCQLVTRL